MGMYTQVRGWLNVDSIGKYGGENLSRIKVLLEVAKENFKSDTTIDADRKWVSDDTVVFSGANNSTYLFIGTELKNYDDDAEKWIKYLIDYFPNAEGRIDFQYEEESPWVNLKDDSEEKSEDNIIGWHYENDVDSDSTYSTYWLIRNGQVILEDKCKTWCKGYGNMFE